jgi:antitoxin component YwqK of YwqJK toxin-antitoxin module
MFVDSLDTVNSSQFGGGTFFDAYTGSDNNGPSATFSFNLEVLHKDTYTNWSDNEGIMTFKYPWGNAGDSLFFKIHFYPNYERVGEIRKNSENGPVLVEFTNNDKTGNGTVKYYDENGNVIDND